MNCPICKKEVKIGGEHMPFCSQHCKQVDLGNWASEKYVISTPIDPNSEILREEAKKNGEN